MISKIQFGTQAYDFMLLFEVGLIAILRLMVVN